MTYRYLLLLPFLLAVTLLHSQARSDFGDYKDWGASKTRVIGMVKLADTTGHEFDRISSVDSNTIKIEEYNPAHRLINVTVLHFVNGVIARQEYTDEWGYNSQTITFTPVSENVLLVTQIDRGKNSMLPCMGAKYIYKNDLLVQIQYVDFNGKPCNCQNGFASAKYVLYEDSTRYGRTKEISYYDEDGNPTINKGTDYHKIIYERDNRGNPLSEEYYNADGHKLLLRSGSFKILKVFDAENNQIEETSLGLNGEIKNNTWGVAKSRWEYKNGLRTKLTFYDVNDNIVKASDTGAGYAVTRFEYNNMGRITRETYYDAEGMPQNNHNGLQKVNYQYNDRDMLVEEAYFDKAGMPVTNRENVHRYVFGRDDKGREISRAFFDANNQPHKNSVEQVYIIKYGYDSTGLVNSESYWRDPDTKMKCWTGTHLFIYKYNAQGLQTEIDSYDEAGKPYLCKNGSSITIKTYDSNSRLSEFSRFDGTTPVLMQASAIKNYHTIRLSYDDKNRISQIEYLDNRNKPASAYIELQGGFECSRIELKYVANTLTEERFYPIKSSYPSKTIDCLKNDYVDAHGINIGHKYK